MHRLPLLFVLLALAWLPGQAHHGALRDWLVLAALPLLTVCSLPPSLAPRRLLPLAPWLGLALLALARAPLRVDAGGGLAGFLLALGWTSAGALGLLAGARPTTSSPPSTRLPAALAAAGVLVALPAWVTPGGSLGNPDLLANVLVFTLLWSGAGLVGHGRAVSAGRAWRDAIPWLAALAVQLGALAAAGSLGAWLALAVGGWGWAWLALGAGRRRRWRLALGTAPLLVLPLLTLPLVGAHLAGRLYLFRLAARVARDAFPWGVGPGAFHAAFLEAQGALLAATPALAGHWTDAAHAHDEALMVLAEQGLPGLLLLAVPLLWALRRAAPHPAWAAALAGAVLAVFSAPLYEPLAATLWAFSCGVCLGWARPATDGHAPQAPLGRRPSPAGPGLVPTPGAVSPLRPWLLAPAVLALLLGSSDLLADRLLARGVATASPSRVGWAGQFALRPARALRQEAALRLTRDPAAAQRLAARAAALEPTPEALLLVGAAALRQREPRAALGPLRRAVRLHPRLFAAHFDLARALDEAGDPFAARRHAQRARSLRPGDPRLRWLPH